MLAQSIVNGRPEFRPKEFSARTFGPIRNEYEGEDVLISPSKKILVGPKVRAENSLGRNSCNPSKRLQLFG